ncbi:oligopeptidase B [Roseibium aquae]|uniref:Oligopeptidase B n=1 Tax=Roseibium aquae TaxID=1323746 RepID=A0A916TKL8_9HYPH|nr:S9 family peptidase [Roseibium aquae]GGB50524.1 oligopeptidase B [Roseibium aquae]
MTKTPTPPRADARPLILKTHGLERQDDYAWLRAENWQEVMREGRAALFDDIEAYLDAENAYQQAVMAPTEELQETLFAEMRGRIKEDDSSVPAPDGPYAYGLKFETGGQQPIFFRTPRDGGAETILLHGDKEAEGKTYFKIGNAGQSPDHTLLAWAYDDKGSEFYSLRLRDIATGTDLDYTIENTGGGGVFSADSRYLFYIRLDDNHRPSRLFRHEVGTDPAGDVLVYEEKDPGFFMGVGKTQSDETILIDIHDHETSEVWMIPADRPLSDPVLIAPRDTGVEYSVEDHGDNLYILTNLGDAEDFKIVTAPKATPGREFWSDHVPHKPGCLILSHTLYKTFMVRLEREDGLPRIVIRRLADNVEHQVAFDEEAYSLGLGGGYEFDTPTIRFSYSSMTTPARTYDYNVETRERVLRKEQEVPSGHTASDYVTRRLQAPAPDGETVPISLFYHKDTPLDGSAPCLLYGYGSYGISIPASFNTNALSLADRGFVYAIAHIRGGKDKGFRWYKDGRREKKTNTFTDFIAAADHLVAQNFTAYQRIVAQGGSAGGMLMGAVANMAPEKFAGIIAEVPFVDVLNTMLDETLPLTPPEWPEWGNPITDKAAFEAIAAYSPYDNVAAKAYPVILAVAGLTDPRVTYWEPAKWVARLRATMTGGNLLMLKTNMDAGHGGASGRFDRLKEVALNQAFALMVVGKA